MVSIPRVVIGAPASGHGKTTVATGLLAAFARRGLTVAPFKVGPDYIDPGYHALAAGRPGRNLDPVLVGEETALKALGSAGGASVAWHKMGEGWSWIQRAGTERDHAAEAAEGWAQIKRDLAAETHRFYVLDEFTYPMKWGWVDVADVVATLTDRPGTQHVVITGRDAHPDLLAAADLVTEMTKVKHPMDAGRKGQQGIEW